MMMVFILGLSIAISGCVKDDFDKPPFNIPEFTLPAGAQLLSIMDLKSRHTAMGQLDSITDNIYITGVVVGNDESGNIYKSLMIQDLTGGIELKLNKTSIFNEYKVGQRIYVKCKNLVLGDYNQLIQLGGVYNGGIGQLPDIAIPKHLFKDSLPGVVPAPRKVFVYSELLPDFVSTLVRFDSVEFVEAGQPYVALGDDNTNRTLKISGGTLTVRNSKYSNFATQLIPSGKGTVIGILSVYNGTYQLALRQQSDIFGFVAPPPVLLEQVFTTDPIATMGWTTQDLIGAQAWSFDAANLYIKISGFSGSNVENEDWLISPSINMTNSNSPSISFTHAAKFGAPATELKVMASFDFDGSNFAQAIWYELSVPNMPSGADWTFIESGNVVLPALFANQDNVHIAFKYTSTTSSASTWEIKGVKVY